jgi:hypothetical protein
MDVSMEGAVRFLEHAEPRSEQAHVPAQVRYGGWTIRAGLDSPDRGAAHPRADADCFRLCCIP